eukprot:COSAG01_NODE_11492_length_1922_cov_148.682940_2_plen_94_part_00
MPQEGVGDDACSWGVDGARVQAWGDGGGKEYGQAWQEGDVIGLAAILDTGAISFGLNGSWDPPSASRSTECRRLGGSTQRSLAMQQVATPSTA